MTASIRQYKNAPNTQAVTTHTYSVSFDSDMLPGSVIVLLFACSDDNGPANTLVVDSQSNVWTKKYHVEDSSGSGDEQFMWYFCQPTTPLSHTDTITVTQADTDYQEMIAFEVIGINQTTPYLDANGAWQQNITGSTANNLATANLAGGSGQVFVIAASMNTLDDGSAPYYPTVGTGLTLGATWFIDAAVANNPLATWGYGTFNAPGSFALHFTSSAASSNDNYVTLAIALNIAATANNTAPIAWIS